MPTREEMIAHIQAAQSAQQPQAPKSREEMISFIQQQTNKAAQQSQPPQQKEGFGKQLLRSTLDALPAIGSAAGGLVAGALATPETLGVGTIPAGIAGASLGYGAGSELSHLGKQYLLGDKPEANIADKPVETLKRMGQNLTEGAAMEMGGQVIGKAVGAGASAVAPYVKAGTEKAGSILNASLKKGGKIFADIPEDFTKEYIAKQGKISARSELDILDDLTSRYKQAEQVLDSSKGAVVAKKDTLKNVRDAAANELRDYKYNLKLEGDKARGALDSKVSQIKERLKNSNVSDLKQNVLDDVKVLKEKISKGSGESYDILDKDPGAYSVRNAAPILRQAADDMNIKAFSSNAPVPKGFRSGDSGASSLPITKQSIGVQNELRSFADLLENTPEKVPARELKKMLQQLDNSEKAMYGQPGFDSRVSGAYKMVRGKIDEAVKAANPEYAAKMQEVADDTGLFSKLLERVGDEGKAISTLRSLKTEKGRAIDFENIKRLGQKTGTDYDTKINNYLRKQDIAASPSRFNKIKERLPEYKRLAQVDDELTRSLDPKTARGIDDLLSVKNAEADLFSSEKALDSAKNMYDVYSPVRDASAQGKLRSLTGARDYNPKKIFSKIDEATGQNFSDEIKNRAILNSFDKASTNGSRKTMLGTVVGGAIGGPVGGIVGGGAGFVADKYAGKMFKSLLDKRIASSGVLNSFKLTPAASKIIEKNPGIVSAILSQLETKPAQIKAAEQRQGVDGGSSVASIKGENKWAVDGYAKVLEQDSSLENEEFVKKALSNPKSKKLLVQASMLSPGSKQMANIITQLKQMDGQ